MQLTPEITLGVLVGLIGTFLYAMSVVVYKSQSENVRPLAASSIKMWIAFPLILFLIVLSLGANPFQIPVNQVILLSISIILGAVLGDTVYLMSQDRIGVSYAFPIAMSFPVLTYFFTVYFLEEPLLLSRLIGVFIAVIGIIMISNQQPINPTPPEDQNTIPQDRKLDAIGVFLAILTAVLYATGTTILQVGVADIDPISGNFIRIFVGSIAFIPMVAVASYRGMKIPRRSDVKVIALAGFFGMGIGSICYVAAVKYAGAAISSVVSSTAPFMALPISIIFLKERPTALALVGVVFTIIGVLLVVLGF